MSCDIHMHVEIKIQDTWYHYNAPEVSCWYDLFAKMAGVRGHVTPIASPRGLPSNISIVTAIAAQAQDSHSHSYLMSSEVIKLKEWVKEVSDTDFPFEDEFGFLFGNTYPGFQYPGVFPLELQDFRFVFWFDN